MTDKDTPDVGSAPYDAPTDEIPAPTPERTVSIPLDPRHMRQRGKALHVPGLLTVTTASIGDDDITDRVAIGNGEVGVLLWTGRGNGFMEYYAARAQSVRVVVTGTFEAGD